jgi:ABC-type nitrate/sulfonate/bicarbonate transport system permease component
MESSSSQRIIFGLGVGALLAFFFGVGLGSSSRKVAAKAGNE